MDSVHSFGSLADRAPREGAPCATLSMLTYYRTSRSLHFPFWAVCSLSGAQPEIWSVGWNPPVHRIASSRFGILREERIRAGINANPRLYSRRTCPFIPAGLSLYSRRAVPLFPQGWRSSPGRHLAPARPAPTAMAGIRAARHCGMRAREDSALTEVGCCPQAAAACKLRGSPRPGPQQAT